jgi:uncharacterized membrane protein
MRMIQVDKEVTVNTSIETIFDYINTPSNLPEFWPSLMEIKDIKLLPNGGYSDRWVYKMLGMLFKGTAECTQIFPHQLITWETKGSIKSTIMWTFRPWGRKTRVTLRVKYKIPIPLLGKWAEGIIVRMNEQEGDAMMAYLRARFLMPSR